MGFAVGSECAEQVEPAVLFTGMGKHCAAVVMHAKQVWAHDRSETYFAGGINLLGWRWIEKLCLFISGYLGHKTTRAKPINLVNQFKCVRGSLGKKCQELG